ncbi:beta-catenin-interacting protein 1 isoform X1 [Amazona aestiva]|uniref:Beta-catenin-interacting protein 1 n=1 Tax=Amazona aestiva TaxID=12930 RepID=A0A0Q3UQL0_AMAAE|nr:beta-catenin-interacting protein 1 isoform X1 [Amazona aestiva]
MVLQVGYSMVVGMSMEYFKTIIFKYIYEVKILWAVSSFFPAGIINQDRTRGLSDLLWFLEAGNPGAGRRGMNREGVPGKSPEEMYIQQKVRVLLMLRKMGSNLTASEEEFLRTYAGVVNSQLSQLPQHSIDQGAEDVVMAFSRSETEDRRQ